MSNIKETNLEYFTEWNNAETAEDRIRVNENWVTVDFNNRELSSYYYSSLYNIRVGEVIKRKRKTIVINGIEVVAPRYDLPTEGDYCYWASSAIGVGFNYVRTRILNFHTANNLAKNGWFDSEDGIREFLAAIKGNTNE